MIKVVQLVNVYLQLFILLILFNPQWYTGPGGVVTILWEVTLPSVTSQRAGSWDKRASEKINKLFRNERGLVTNEQLNIFVSLLATVCIR